VDRLSGLSPYEELKKQGIYPTIEQGGKARKNSKEAAGA